MKKNLLVAIAAIAAVSASAQVAPSIQVADLQPAQLDLTTSKVVKKSGINKASAIAKITATDGKLNFAPYYYIPDGGFFSTLIVTNSETGSKATITPGLYPLNHKLAYTADTYISRAVAGATWDGDRADFQYTWSYLPDLFAQNEETFAGSTLEYAIPASNYIYPVDGPVLSWKYGDLTVENQETSLLLMNNGVARMNLGGVASNLELTTIPINGSFPGLITIGEASYGPADSGMDDMSYTAFNNSNQMEKWGNAFANSFNVPLDTAEVVAFGFHMGYNGAPYMLKSLNLILKRLNSADQDLNIAIFNDDLDTNEPIYTTTVRCKANTENALLEHEIVMESEDEDGIPVEYIKVDGPLTVMITGIEKFDYIAPCLVSYPITDAESLGYPYDGFTYVKLEGGDIERYIESDYSYWLYGQEGLSPHSFLIYADVEYPVLQPTGYYSESDIIPATDPNGQASADIHDIAFRESNVYTINIPTGDEGACVIFATSAELADQMFFDDENLPSWLMMEVGKTVEEVAMSNGLLYTGYDVIFAFDTEGTDRVAEIPVSYKSQHITLRIVQGNDPNPEGALGAIEAEGNGAVEYFDIQGRKLNAAPATGFFIQKQGNKVSKVIR